MNDVSISGENPTTLNEIAKEFLIIGSSGFGGGMAIIALMQERCVSHLHWLEPEEFAHGVALGQVLGPFALNAATFVGFRLRGAVGAMVAAIAFMAPSVTIVIALSALYFKYHHIPALQSALHGIGPVVIALIVTAAIQLARGNMKGILPWVIVISAFTGSIIWHVPIVMILLISALAGALELILITRLK